MGLGDQSHVDRFFKHFMWETMQGQGCWAADLENNCHQELCICQRNSSSVTQLCLYFVVWFFFLTSESPWILYNLKLPLWGITRGRTLLHTQILAKIYLHTFKVKEVFVAYIALTHIKPYALFPLVLSNCWKPRAPAALQSQLQLALSWRGCMRGRTTSPALLPHGPIKPLQRAWAALCSWLPSMVSQRRSQPFAWGPTSARKAGSGKQGGIPTPAIQGEEGWLWSWIHHLSLSLTLNIW